MFLDHAFEYLVCIHQVLADYDVEGSASLCPALAQSCNYVPDDKLEYSRTYRGGHDVTFCDCVRSSLGIVSIDCRHVLYQYVSVAFTADVSYRVTVLLPEFIDDRFGHVYEGDFIFGFAEEGTDEAAADIASSVHYCLFHGFCFFKKRGRRFRDTSFLLPSPFRFIRSSGLRRGRGSHRTQEERHR